MDKVKSGKRSTFTSYMLFLAFTFSTKLRKTSTSYAFKRLKSQHLQ